jgi:hypothetical protein
LNKGASVSEIQETYDENLLRLKSNFETIKTKRKKQETSLIKLISVFLLYLVVIVCVVIAGSYLISSDEPLVWVLYYTLTLFGAFFILQGITGGIIVKPHAIKQIENAIMDSNPDQRPYDYDYNKVYTENETKVQFILVGVILFVTGFIMSFI